MKRLKIMNFLLDKSTMTIQEMTDKIGVNRSNYYLWRDGKTVPKKSTINKLAELLEVRLVWDGSDSVKIADERVQVTKNQITIEGGKGMNMSANEILDIYRENRELRIEVKNLKKNKKPESTHWENLEYDYIAETKLIRQRLKFGRVIKKITDLKKQSDILGYSKKELLDMWDVGVEHIDMKNHPIEKIISKESQLEIRKQSLTLPIIFDALKSSLGDHYIPQPIMYIHKKGHHIGAISYNKVEWSKMNVISKVQFLSD